MYRINVKEKCFHYNTFCGREKFDRFLRIFNRPKNLNLIEFIGQNTTLYYF